MGLKRSPGAEISISLSQGMSKQEQWSIPAQSGSLGGPSQWWQFPIGCWVEVIGVEQAELNGRLGRVVAHHAGQSKDRFGVDLGDALGKKAFRTEKLRPSAPPSDMVDRPELQYQPVSVARPQPGPAST